MVLFDEDPVTLISETTNQFHIAPDKDSLSRISSSLSALALNRSSRLETQQSSLKSLSRRLNTLRSQCDYEEGRHDAGRHASEILALDGEKFRIAKAVNEVDVEGERLGTELSGLKKTLDVLEKEGIEGSRRVGSTDEDETVLKLQVFRSLGVDLQHDSSSSRFHRAVVRNVEKGDVNIIDLNGTRSRKMQANALWNSL